MMINILIDVHRMSVKSLHIPQLMLRLVGIQTKWIKWNIQNRNYNSELLYPLNTFKSCTSHVIIVLIRELSKLPFSGDECSLRSSLQLENFYFLFRSLNYSYLFRTPWYLYLLIDRSLGCCKEWWTKGFAMSL